MTSGPALDPSAARAAVAQLYAAARPAVSMAGVSGADLVGVVEACRAAVRSLEAVETLAVARLAATEEILCEDGTVQEICQGLGYRRLDAPDLVSAVFGVCAQQASGPVWRRRSCWPAGPPGWSMRWAPAGSTPTGPGSSLRSCGRHPGLSATPSLTGWMLHCTSPVGCHAAGPGTTRNASTRGG